MRFIVCEFQIKDTKVPYEDVRVSASPPAPRSLNQENAGSVSYVSLETSAFSISLRRVLPLSDF